MWITALAPELGTIANLLPFFLVSAEVFNGALMFVYCPFFSRFSTDMRQSLLQALLFYAILLEMAVLDISGKSAQTMMVDPQLIIDHILKFQWYVRGLLGVLLHDVPVVCSENELVAFLSPPGETYVISCSIIS